MKTALPPHCIRLQLLFLWLAATFGPNACAQQPANDNFTNRIVLTGSAFTLTGTTLNATLESQESAYWLYRNYFISNSGKPTNSVWYSWTPTQSVVLVVEQVGMDIAAFDGSQQIGIFPYSNGVYTGFPSTLSGWSYYLDHLIARYCEAGVDYAIGVAGTLPAFSLKLTTYPTNAPVFLQQPVAMTCPADTEGFLFATTVGLRNSPWPNPPNWAAQIDRRGGFDPVTIAWERNGVVLAEQDWPYLALPSVRHEDAGDYRLIVHYDNGWATSEVARITVQPTNFPGGASPPVFEPLRRLVEPVSGEQLVRVVLRGESNVCYRLLESTNLLDWADWWAKLNWWSQPPLPPPFLTINAQGLASFTNQLAADRKFFKAVRHAPAREVCVSQLKELEWAKRGWARDWQNTATATPNMNQLVGTDAYVKPRTGGMAYRALQCPEGGVYQLNNLLAKPQCSVPGHTID